MHLVKIKSAFLLKYKKNTLKFNININEIICNHMYSQCINGKLKYILILFQTKLVSFIFICK